MKPVLVDVSLEDLAVDPAHLEEVFERERPGAFFCVSVLGLPPPMDQILELCARYDVALLEDACESLGSAYAGRPLGSFGTMASYSLYYGHHLSTIEGGMVCTDDDELARLLRMLRSHGWDRDLGADDQAALRSRWKRSEFDAAYTFYVPGFNLRSTDLQARIGLMQLERMDAVIARREANFKRYVRRLGEATWTPTIEAGHRVSCFAYPVLDANRDALVEALASRGVETRPLICGSMGNQPFFVERFGRQDLPGASRVDREGLYVPCHDRMTDDEVDLVAETIFEASR
jgi:CDP-6-deoxy-D-xylo-4-hexulose-3-dehydrase